MFQLNEQVAEFIGALIGDGCLSEYYSKSEKTRRFEIAFTGSLDDFEYYSEIIQPLCSRNFGFSGRLFKRENSTRFHVRSTVLFDFLKNLGLPVGKKGKLMKIPEGIFLNEKLMRACVKGIFNTDGSIYRRKIMLKNKQYNYLVLGLKMEAKPVLEQTKQFLESKNIACSNLTKSNNCFVLTINSQPCVFEFLNQVRFSNKHHLKRIKFLMNA